LLLAPPIEALPGADGERRDAAVDDDLAVDADLAVDESSPSS
jgi:hypothetical protein